MSTWIHAEPRVGTGVSLKGPHGSFFLRTADTPALCIAGRSGLAPIKALLEQMVSDEPTGYVFIWRAYTK